ncbi:ANTAR domain-containing protein [Streptomyces sp. Tue6028]|uniref:ANTAR domain-containing protein n=1 Tax=Streptomyces sp. Tue6028 TaxID=2036037 RepID=UPI003EB8341D
MIGHDEHEDRKITALRQEVEQLRRAMDSHALIDQAIGVVITVGGLRREQGWDVLKHISQHTNVKLREVAGCLVHWPAGEHLPELFRRALPRALDHVRRMGDEGTPDGEEEEGAGICGRAS